METGNGAGTSSGQTPAAVGRFWRAFAVVVVALRFPIVIGWIAAAVAATFFLPGIAASGAIGGLIPPDSPALRAEADAAKLFGEPLASAQVAVVQRDPLERGHDLGLVRPTAGTATIDGRRYAELEHPARTVGALLDA